MNPGLYRNLLFAVLALQDGLLDQPGLVAAFRDWSTDSGRDLGQILLARGTLSDEDHGRIETLLREHLARGGGDVRATLAGVIAPETRDFLGRTAGGAVEDSLATLVPSPGYIRLEALSNPGGASRSRYTLTRLHAEGGLGRVWVARDVELNREVALKEIKPRHTDRPESRARFLKEAQVGGQLEHPNIVPVYELAHRPEDGEPFYTMRLVRGRTLREAVALHHAARAGGRADPLELPRLVDSFVAVAQAVAFAHSRGVLHRDLKPENVVLGDFGEAILLDWGLAKKLDGEADAPPLRPVELGAEADTGGTYSAVGTPAYMAPEQARNDASIDRRADVYGLGAILFEILAGRPPHAGGTVEEVLRRVIEGETPRARSVVATAPPALDAICSRAMAKDPSDRYPSAEALILDVRRWRADEPVSAYRDPFPARAGRWARRHRTTVAAASVLVVTALFASLLGNRWLGAEKARTETARLAAQSAYERERVERLEKERQRALAVEAGDRERKARLAREEALRHVEDLLVSQDVAAAQRSADRGDLSGALLWFHRALPHLGGDPDRIGLHKLGIDLALRQCARLEADTAGRFRVARAAFDGSGRRAALLQPRSYEQIPDDQGGGSPAQGGTSSTLQGAMRAVDPKIVIWDVEAGAPSREPIPLPPFVDPDGLAFSPGGRLVAIWGPRKLLVFEADTGRVVVFEIGDWGIIGGEFSPDERTFLTAEVATNVHAPVGPDGLMTGEPARPPGQARLWDVASGRPIGQPAPHSAIVYRARFGAGGRAFATASADGSARVWSAADGTPLSPPLSHRASVTDADLDSEGRRVVTASVDRNMIFWEVASGRPLFPPLLHPWSVWLARFGPGGHQVFTICSKDSRDEEFAVSGFDASTGDRIYNSIPYREADLFALIGPDGRRILTVRRDDPNSPGGTGATSPATARVHEVATGKPVGTAYPTEGSVRMAAFSPDGTRAALISRSGDPGPPPSTAGFRVRTMLLTIGRPDPIFLDLPTDEAVNHAEFSPDGRTLLTASGLYGSAARLRIWDTATGKPTGTDVSGPGALNAASFRPDGRRVATAGTAGVEIRDVDKGSLVARLAEGTGADRAVYDPEGRRLLVVFHDGSARIFDAERGTPLFDRTFAPIPAGGAEGSSPGGSPADAQNFEVELSQFGSFPGFFGAGGRLVFTGVHRGGVVGHDARTGEAEGPVLRHQSGRILGAWSVANGRGLITAGDDRTVRVRDRLTGAEVAPALRHHLPVQQELLVDGGRKLVTAGFKLEQARSLAFPPKVLSAPGIPKVLPSQGPQPFPPTPPDRPLPWHASLSPDGRRAVLDQGDSVRVLDTGSGGPIGPALWGAARFAEFGTDGRRVLVAHRDGPGRVWDTAPGTPVDSNVAARPAFDVGADFFQGVSHSIEVKTWDASPPGLSDDELRRLAESLALRKVDSFATVEPIDPNEPGRAEVMAGLRSRHPGLFRSSPAELASWDTSEALVDEGVGRWAAAVPRLRALTMVDPDDSLGHARLSRALLRSGDLAGSLEQFVRTRELDPAEADRWAATEARYHQGRREWPPVVWYLDRYAARHAREPAVLRARAVALAELGEWSRALADARDIAKSIKGPMDNGLLVMLATLACAAGDQEGYLRDLGVLLNRAQFARDAEFLDLVTVVGCLDRTPPEVASRVLDLAKLATGAKVDREDLAADREISLAAAELRAGRVGDSRDRLNLVDARLDKGYPGRIGAAAIRARLWAALAHRANGEEDLAGRALADVDDRLKEAEKSLPYQREKAQPPTLLGRIELRLIRAEAGREIKPKPEP